MPIEATIIHMNSIHESESVFQLNDFVYGSLASQCERRSGCAESRLDACIAAMAWWMLGWGFAYGDVPQYGFIGREQCAFLFFCFGQGDSPHPLPAFFRLDT